MRQIPSIEDIKNIAIGRGGLCLSNSYINNRGDLQFECKEHHKWFTCWKNINKGSWCPNCALLNNKGKNNKKFDTLENMQNIAKERGGKCLSNEYLGAHIKLRWSCNLDHEWDAKPNNIKNGSWCPKCSDGIGERLCRHIFESIFGYKFQKIRPNWLENPITGSNLELDGYCKELNIAFEYNGEQHYREVSIYSRSKYDLIKIQLCQKNNTKLFLIKEIKGVNHYKEIIDNIKIQSEILGVNLPIIPEININEVYKSSRSIIYLDEIRNIAIKNGGKCLSNTYIDTDFKLDFQCGKCNFIWQASPCAIKNGTWCPNCANKNIGLNDAINLAKIKNGKCLSEEYTNSYNKMNWQCEFNHEWKASYNRIQSGNWCPICFKQNRGKSKILKIDIYKEAAKNKGGELLSNNVSSCYDKLEWKCDKNHTWFARADMIKNTKQWCPNCAVIKKRKNT